MKNVIKSIQRALGFTLMIALVGTLLGTVSPARSSVVSGASESVMELLIPSAHALSPEAEAAINRAKTEDAGEAKKPVDFTELVKKAAQLSNYVHLLFNPLIHFFTFKIGALLSNDYVYESKMGEMLQNIWRINRNVVNIVFVLILLYLALKHIFAGEGEGGTDLKKVLPSFALMLIAVNFSWLGSRVVLDAANVATNVMFGIPAAVKAMVKGTDLEDLIKKDCTITYENGKMEGLCAPDGRVFSPTYTTHTVNLKSEDCDDIEEKYNEAYPAEAPAAAAAPPAAAAAEGAAAPATAAANPDESKLMYGVQVFCWKNMDLGDYNQNNASYFVSYSMAQVQKLPQASTANISKIAIGTLLSLLIQIIYLIAFACLFIALIFRVVFLWFFIAFAPLLVLVAFLKSHVSEISMESETVSLKSFVHWAFAPAGVAAVWSVGFIMIITGQSAGMDAKESLFDTLDRAGKLIGGGKIYEVNALFMGMDNLQQFVWLIMTICIIWIGTFAVLTKLKIADSFFKKIETAGNSIAEKVATSPTWAPIIPLGGRMQSLSGTVGLGKINQWLDESKAKFTGNTAGLAFDQAAEKLKNISSDKIQQELIEKILKNPDKSQAAKLAVEFITKNGGISAELMRNNPRMVSDMLNTSHDMIKARSTELASLIEEGLRNTPTAPAPEVDHGPAPAAPAAAPAAAAPSASQPPAASNPTISSPGNNPDAVAEK